MKQILWALAGVAILLCLGSEARAAERQVRLDWGDLASNVTGRKISTVLTDGVTLEGRVVSVKPEALVVKVNKTSAPARFRDTADIPRDLVSAVRVSRPGWKWRVIGPVAGFVAGGVAGFVIGGRADPHGFIISDGAATGTPIGAFGGAGLGYLIGHFADQHTTMIQIVR